MNGCRMVVQLVSIGSLVCLFLCSIFGDACAQQQQVSLPQWKKGELEIHHIYTGRGESSFLIFPDGTTMLVDAGDWDPRPGKGMLEIWPDSTRRSGEWIARYIRSLLGVQDTVDYFLATHFDSDHIGSAGRGHRFVQDRGQGYMISGISHVGEFIHFRKFIDRDYPTYRFPIAYDKLSFRKDFENYRHHIEWLVKNQVIKVERFAVGSDKQIGLVKKPGRYPGFSITNIVGNGVLWRKGQQSIDSLYFHKDQTYGQIFNENTMSLGFVLSYGNFRYFAAGDLSGGVRGPDGKDIGLEGIVGREYGPVHVAKANHHAYLDAMTEGFVRGIRARHFVVPVWDIHHIQAATIQRMGLTGSDIFFTRFPESKRGEFQNNDWMERVAATDGHVVIRVEKGGKRYFIYHLDATNERKVVKARYGPFYTKDF